MYIHVILIIVQVLGSVCVQKTEIHFKCQIENFVEESPSRKRTVGIVDVKVFLKFTSTCKKIHIQLHEYWTCNYTPGNKLQGV